jgi:hypothetical protein
MNHNMRKNMQNVKHYFVKSVHGALPADIGAAQAFITIWHIGCVTPSVDKSPAITWRVIVTGNWVMQPVVTIASHDINACRWGSFSHHADSLSAMAIANAAHRASAGVADSILAIGKLPAMSR